ncbi:MAG: Maf family protein [Methanobacteriota archaeon]
MKAVKSLMLVSSSPRRFEILMGVVPGLKVISPTCKEVPVLTKDDLISNAARKLESVKLAKKGVAISADTAVFLDGRALGKPSSPAEAVEMLRSLSGRWHEVVTGVALYIDGKVETSSETTRVLFKKLDDAAIRSYVATGEPLDKAGAYGIQGLGGRLVEKIEGDYHNVVGLPLPLLESMLESHGLALPEPGKDI